MALKAIEETQVVVTAKKEYPTEDCIWDFININSRNTENKKRLLIIGDSITAGIYGVINEIINSAWCVDSFTTSLPINDRDFIPTLRNALLQSGLPYDVIHFNNGGHGIETAEVFEEAYRQVIALIKEIHPDAKIVLATSVSTFVPEPDGTFIRPLEKWHMYTDGRNKICRELCEEYDFELNDLAEYSLKIKDDHVADGIHYNKEGSKKLAFQVIKFAR